MSHWASTSWRVVSWPFWAVSRPPVWAWRGVGYLLTSFRFWLLLILTVLVLLIVYHSLADAYTPITTDAYVQAYVVQVAPQVAGQVVRVYAREGEKVKAGSVLFEIDPRPFEYKIAQLEAKLVDETTKVQQLTTTKHAAEAEHAKLQAEAAYAATVHEQERAMWQKAATTERKYLEARDRDRAAKAAFEKSAVMIRHVDESLASLVGREHAYIAQAKALLGEAKLNLSYARVTAPCDGIVTDLQLREGAYTHVGQAAMTLIDTSSFLVIGNFRENSLRNVRVNMPAIVGLQGVPGRLFTARVATLGWGVQHGQGVPSGSLPNVRRETSWVQPAQRFQVRLALDEGQDVELRVGMTGSVSIYVEPAGDLNEVTRALHQLVAWLYYL
ncbi:MAG: HlyD family secretion protein [Gemmataceae bacterium]